MHPDDVDALGERTSPGDSNMRFRYDASWEDEATGVDVRRASRNGRVLSWAGRRLAALSEDMDPLRRCRPRPGRTLRRRESAGM